MYPSPKVRVSKNYPPPPAPVYATGPKFYPPPPPTENVDCEIAFNTFCGSIDVDVFFFFLICVINLLLRLNASNWCMAIFPWIVFYHSLCLSWYLLLRRRRDFFEVVLPVILDVASCEVSFRKSFPLHFLLFRISPRRKLHPVHTPVSKFGNSPVFMLCKFAILLQEQILTISPTWWGLLSVALHLTSFSLSILLLITALDQWKRENLYSCCKDQNRIQCSLWWMGSLCEPFTDLLKSCGSKCSLERFSNEDGNGNENVSSKYFFSFFWLFRDYAKLSHMENAEELPRVKISGNGVKIRKKEQRFTVMMRSCSRKNLKIGHWEDDKEMYKTLKRAWRVIVCAH